MKTWMKVTLVALLFGLPTIPLGRLIWQDPVSTTADVAPSGIQLGFLIGVSVFEAAAFGLGVAFLIFGLHVVRRVLGDMKGLTWASYFSIAWLLVSWWPHDNLHRVTTSLDSLIVIEYTFHVTLILAGSLVAITFLKLLVRRGILEEAQTSVARPEAQTLGMAPGR
jgi:hypothetical protein